MMSYLYSVTAEAGGAAIGKIQATNATVMTAHTIDDRPIREPGTRAMF